MGVQIQGDTGNVIATKGTYSGNVTIGGTLTYEDVTNIDSVGLITARGGIEVGARPGVAASISVDGNAIFSGITTIGENVKVGTGVTISDGGIHVTGVITSTTFVGSLTGTSTNANHISVADNPSTNENNLIPFIENASATGNVGLESDGDFTYNPSTGTVSATHFSSNSGTTIQRQFKYLTATGQLTKGGSVSELNTDLRIAFTPKFADSNLLMEFDSSYVSPNTTNLYYCLFYDVTNSAGVSLPGANGSRVRCHWTKRTSPNDNNDNDHISMRIVTPANNTTARTYTIHFGSEGATAQFFVSTLSTGGGSIYPMTFTITEIAA